MITVISTAIILCSFIYICIVIKSSWMVWREMLRCNSAKEIRYNAEKRSKVYGTYCIISFLGFVIIPVVKAIAMLAGIYRDRIIVLIAMGTTQDITWIDRFGFIGLLWGAISILCAYQYLKSVHHLQILYALRKQLSL